MKKELSMGTAFCKGSRNNCGDDEDDDMDWHFVRHKRFRASHSGLKRKNQK